MIILENDLYCSVINAPHCICSSTLWANCWDRRVTPWSGYKRTPCARWRYWGEDRWRTGKRLVVKQSKPLEYFHPQMVFSLILYRSFFLQEDELRMSGDPRYSHLLEDLHVEISTFAAPAEAHARIAYALAEVRRFLVPVSGLSERSHPTPPESHSLLRRGH